MTREEAVKRLLKYGQVKQEQEFLEIKVRTHQHRMKHAENEHSKQLEQYRLDRLMQSVEENRAFMEDIESCLEFLPEREKMVLWHFYVQRTYDYIEILNEKINVERSQIYRIKDRAITSFAALYTKAFY